MSLCLIENFNRVIHSSGSFPRSSFVVWNFLSVWHFDASELDSNLLSSPFHARAASPSLSDVVLALFTIPKQTWSSQDRRSSTYISSLSFLFSSSSWLRFTLSSLAMVVVPSNVLLMPVDLHLALNLRLHMCQPPAVPLNGKILMALSFGVVITFISFHVESNVLKRVEKSNKN